MKTILKKEHLTNDKIHPNKGKYLVIELIVDHEQDECSTIPKGTRGVIIATNKEFRHAVLFPHQEGSLKEFRDGDVRVLTKEKFIALGRIDHK